MAILVCNMLDLPDPTLHGSKNPGATNVLRLGGKLPAAYTLIGDALKGFIPVVFARFLGLNSVWVVIILLSAVIGHMYPIYYQFKGGKGIATSFGGALGMGFLFGSSLALVWLIVAFVTRLSSLAALITALAAPIIGFWLFNIPAAIALAILAAIIAYKHRENIERILSGDEPKIGEK